MNLSAIEAALLPIAEPLILKLWSETILPALASAEAKIANPALKIIGDAELAALDAVVKAELAKLV